MTPAKDVHVTIGNFKLRIGDIKAYDGFDIILVNGMRIKREKFRVKTKR